MLPPWYGIPGGVALNGGVGPGHANPVIIDNGGLWGLDSSPADLGLLLPPVSLDLDLSKGLVLIWGWSAPLPSSGMLRPVRVDDSAPVRLLTSLPICCPNVLGVPTGLGPTPTAVAAVSRQIAPTGFAGVAAP